MPKSKKSQSLRVYVVICEFNEDDEYEDFFDALNEYPDWRRISDDTDNFFVCSDSSAEDVYDDLFENMFEGDAILVCEINKDNYYSCLPKETIDWMDSYLE
jgi:hypothetical protein